jgi:hypothetical protein
MKYQEYEDFINHRMRMSHVYQPVMLMTLLKKGGKASAREIARAILEHDELLTECVGFAATKLNLEVVVATPLRVEVHSRVEELPLVLARNADAIPR